jgi:threonine dehydratase
MAGRQAAKQVLSPLAGIMNEALSLDDDIVLSEYIKRDNRETGAALWGIERGSTGRLPSWLDRIEASPLRIQHLAPGTTAFRSLV